MYEPNNPQSDLYLKNRRELEMGGVNEVLSYAGDEIRLQTVLGKLLLRGDAMKIVSFCAETGQFSVSGMIAALIYTDETSEREGLLKRLFR